MLQQVAVSCSMLQCIAIDVDKHNHTGTTLVCACVRCSVLQCVAVCCSVLQAGSFSESLYWIFVSFFNLDWTVGSVCEGKMSWRLCVWAGPKLVRPRRWGSSKLGPSIDSEIRMVNWGTTIQDPTRVRETDTLLVFYIFVLYSVTCLKICRFIACFTSPRISISILTWTLQVTSSRFCSYLLILITLLTGLY